jgi:arylsulfatase A-like enzyme
MKKKDLIKTTSVFFMIILLGSIFSFVKAQNNEKPNVVFMLADNVGYGDIGGAFQGGEIRGMPTPRIDKLQSEGLVLTQFITEPGCTPSRAGLMTGRYAHRAGCGSIIVPGSANTLKAEEVTMAELFKTAGLQHSHDRQMALRWRRGKPTNKSGL